MSPTQTLFRLLRQSCLLLPLAACAVQYSAVHMTPAATAADASPRTLARGVDIQLDTGYRRALKDGSRWMHIGRVPQGEVYQPFKDVFTLEGAHIHEAYLVVERGVLVGFFLPAEGGFSPLKQSVPITLQ